MDTTDKIKEAVRDKYGSIAQRATVCRAETVPCIGDDYTNVDGHLPEADLGLGCGIPTEVALIKPGDTVLDLGSGAGNDVFVARALVGEVGRVIGVDMTEAMIEKAKMNATKVGLTGVEFRLGEIEALPVDAASIDVVISNCVLNLVPNKRQAYREIGRVLKPGGHFSISDLVIEGRLPESVRKVAETYAGCVAGTVSKDEYLGIIEESGFINVRLAKQKAIAIPTEFLRDTLAADELRDFLASGGGIVSVTVYGEKPL